MINTNMKTVKSICLLLMFNIGLNAQAKNHKLELMSDNAAKAFSHYIGINSSKQSKVKEIYYEYYRMLTSQDWSSDYIHSIKKIETDKEKSLKSLLSDHEHRTYLYLDEVLRRGQYEYYDEIASSIRSNPLLVKELKNYFSTNIFPAVSALKFEFEQVLPAEDCRQMMRYSSLFAERLDSLLANDIPLSEKSIQCLLEPVNHVDAIIQKHEASYNTALMKFIPMNKKWKSDVDEIFINNGYTEQQVEVWRAPQEVLSVYGLNNLMDRLKFSQIEPFNETKYLRDLIRFRALTEDLILFLAKN